MNHTHSHPPALSIRNLKKTYHNGVEALKGIDLEVKEGDFFGLLGPNGAGKSTLIGTITSLVNKTSGEVTIFGCDLDREREAAKVHIGLVPQEFNFNIFQPIGEMVVNQGGFYGIQRKEAWRRTEKWLRKFDLWERRTEVPRSLSGGMKRRLMIARALVHEPKLLILDEPTAGVDIEIRRTMWDFLRELNEGGTTIILTTHYLEEAERLCRYIAIINHGRLMENGPTHTLLDKMQADTFVLDVRDAIGEVPKLPGYRLERIDNHTLEVDVPKEYGINKLFEALSQQGISVYSMRNKQNRLERLFMDVISH